MDEATKIKKLKEQEAAPEGGGCRIIVILFGLLFMAVGFYVIFFVEGKPSAIATASETTLFVAETAVSTSATPTLVPTATATATASPTATASVTATAQPTHTPLPTQTPYPTHTPYPSATWTAQPTFTLQATHTAQPTYTPYPTATPTASATAQPTAAPVVTERPYLAPVAVAADPPDDGSPLPWAVGLLVGSLIILALAALMLVAYVSHQMRTHPPGAPVLITPDGTTTPGGQLPPPDWQPVLEPRPAPVSAPVTPVSPPGGLPEVAPVQNAAPPEKIEVSVTAADPSVDEATMRAICAAWNEIEARGEKPSLNKLCTEYFGGKNSERMAIARRAVKWGRGKGLIGHKQGVKTDDSAKTRPEPAKTTRRRRRPIPVVNRHGRTQLN